MIKQGKIIDNKLVYVMCPMCRNMREKVDGKFNIIKRGKERNGIARFFCTKCKTWFNERTGDSLKWLER